MQACEYWIKKSSGTPKTPSFKAGLQCGKMCNGKEKYCPKHILVVQYEEERYHRAGIASGKARAHKAAVEYALARSPLAAYNPDFRGKDDGR